MGQYSFATSGGGCRSLRRGRARHRDTGLSGNLSLSRKPVGSLAQAPLETPHGVSHLPAPVPPIASPTPVNPVFSRTTCPHRRSQVATCSTSRTSPASGMWGGGHNDTLAPGWGVIAARSCPPAPVSWCLSGGQSRSKGMVAAGWLASCTPSAVAASGTGMGPTKARDGSGNWELRLQVAFGMCVIVCEWCVSCVCVVCVCVATAVTSLKRGDGHRASMLGTCVLASQY